MPFLYEFTIDNEKVEGQIGFSTSIKWEEALDEATLVIPFTYENDVPYKMLSMLNVEITEIDNYTDKNIVETRTYEFIVYSDTPVSLGSYGYYRHQVNAIEYTAKLDYYMINNLSKSKSVLRNGQAPFETFEIAPASSGQWFAKVTLENIGLKENFFANKDLVFDQVYQAYVATSALPEGFKRTNAVIRTNATLVSGTSPHVLSDGPTTWVFPEGEWEIEYGFIADGTEGYSYDVGFNAIYKFYVEAVNEYELTMYNLIDEIRTSISKFGGIEDTIYFNETRIFDIDSSYETYLKSIKVPQIYLSQATARQMLIYCMSFMNALPRLEYGEILDTLTLENYNLATGTFIKNDVIAYGGKQNTNQIGTKNYQPIGQALANNLDDTSIHSPSRTGYQQVRSLDIQLTADNFTIKLPEKSPLYLPKKLVVLIPEIEVYANGGIARLIHLTNFELDITPRWINDEEWKLKEITTNFPTITSREIWDSELGLRSYKVENLTWKTGDTQINLSTVFGTLFEDNLIRNVVLMGIYEYIMLHPPVPIDIAGDFYGDMEIVLDIPAISEYKDWRFRVEYITDERLVIKQDKEDLSQISFYSEMRQNQEEALVDLVRQSRKGYGDLQRTGNRTFSFPKKHISLDEFYTIGQKDSDDFTITQIDTQWFNDYAIAIYHITKYHNRIQQATFVNQKYRPFDNFAKSVLDRHEHYGDYLIALPPDDFTDGVQEQSTKIYTNNKTVRRITQILLGDDFFVDNPGETSATVALIRTDGMLNSNPDVAGTDDRKFVISPVTSRGIKGGFTFTIGFKSNQVAGDGLIVEGTNYYNSAVRYTDKKGRFTRFGFAIMKDLDYDADDVSTFPLLEDNISELGPYFSSNTYFWCGYSFAINQPFENPLVWNKDPLTNAQLTYQLNVLSYYVGLYIFGLKFFTENYIVKEHELINGAVLYLYTDGTKHEIFKDLFVKSGYDSSVELRDNEVLGDGNIEYNHYSNTVLFVGISMVGITSWAIGIPNEDGDIELLVACNENLGGVRFVNRHFRPNILEIGSKSIQVEFTVIELGLELSGDFVYVRGGEVQLDMDSSFNLTTTLTHVRGGELEETLDLTFGLTIPIEFFRDDSVPLDIISAMELSNTLTFTRGTELEALMDLGLNLSNTLTYTRGGEVETILDFAMNLANDVQYFASKDIGSTIDLLSNLSTNIIYIVTKNSENTINLALEFGTAITYQATTNIGATIDLSLSMSFDIQYTKAEIQYASPTIEVATGTLGSDGGGTFVYAFYRVRNNDADAGRVGSIITATPPSFVISNLVELTSGEWSDYIEITQYYTGDVPKLYAQTRDIIGESDKDVSDIVVWDSWA